MPSATGNLDWQPLESHLDLVAAPVAAGAGQLSGARVAEIDPALADTAAFCKAYDVAPESSANCVVIVGRRGGETRYAAVMVLATMRADVNGVIRRLLDVRKCSFAPMEETVALTGMEYGGITPIGLPPEWPIMVDDAVASAGVVVIGAGVRAAKLLIPGDALIRLPGAEVIHLSR